MKFLSRKKSSSSIRSTATLWLNRRAGASSTSLNLTTAATTYSHEEETLDSLIQASERARAASSRLAAAHGVALPSAPPSASPSGRDKKVRTPSVKGAAPPSHLRSSPGRQRSRLAEDGDAVPSHYAEPPPEYQTWYDAEGAAFQKYRYVSKSGIRRTQLRAPPPPVPLQMDNTPATRLGTTFSNSSRPSLALPEPAPTPPSPYSHSRMARSSPDLSSTPRATPVSSRSVAFSPANRDGSEREVPSMSRRPLISGPQALQPRQRLRTLSVSTQGSRSRRTPRSSPPSPDRLSTRSHGHRRRQSSSSSASSSSSQSFTPFFRLGSGAQTTSQPPLKGILKSSSAAPSVMSMPLGNWDARSTRSKVTFDSRSAAGSSRRTRALSAVKRLFKKDGGG